MSGTERFGKKTCNKNPQLLQQKSSVQAPARPFILSPYQGSETETRAAPAILSSPGVLAERPLPPRSLRRRVLLPAPVR